MLSCYSVVALKLGLEWYCEGFAECFGYRVKEGAEYELTEIDA